MAQVVLVHGIAQEQRSADTLERNWLPALAGGIRTSGATELADAIWRNGPRRDIDIRMAFYGDLFIAHDQQGIGDPFAELSYDAAALVYELALAWLHTAAKYAVDERDRRDATQALQALHNRPTSPKAGACYAPP